MQSLIISGKICRKTKTALFLFLIVASLFFTGCVRSKYNNNFTLRLALVDGFMAQNEQDDALSALKKAQKSAFSIAQRLSVIKRYQKLGASELAEKFLLSSMKKLPDSIELAAVYVQSMLEKGDLEAAALYAPKLKGTWFDSLYVETSLRQIDSSSLFYDSRFSEMYQSAYKATGDERWLRNSAALLAAKGSLKEAARLHPGVYSVDEKPYFWVLIDYDAENYNRCIEGCNFIMEHIPEEKAAASLICSDAWLQSGDYEGANNWWLSQLEKGQKESASAVIYKNAAHYAVLHNDSAAACRLLTEVTEKYPEYVPALVAYVNYAIAGDIEQKEWNAAHGAFKNSNLKTIAMEEHDAIPRIPLEDALQKLEQSLAEHYSPELLVEYKRVCWQMQSAKEEQCLSELWSLLEKNRLGDHDEPYLIRWAVSWLCAHHNETTAADLFSGYLIETYGYDEPVSYMREMENWECEYSAWFALRKGDYETALILYEYRFNERETLPDESVLMNCAAVYTAEDNYRKALEIYSALAPSIEDPVTLSEVQYRIGAIQYDLREKRNALLSLAYSIKLNPDNHRARLLLKQIE